MRESSQNINRQTHGHTSTDRHQNQSKKLGQNTDRHLDRTKNRWTRLHDQTATIFDRGHPCSRPGAPDKKDGAGAHNWGTSTDDAPSADWTADTAAAPAGDGWTADPAATTGEAGGWGDVQTLVVCLYILPQFYSLHA